MKEFLETINLDSLSIWIIAALVFVVLDIVSGLGKAVATHDFKTSVMRQGLIHKMGSVLAILLFVLIDIFQHYIDLSRAFSDALGADGLRLNINLTPWVCGYIILMEVMSIIENICVINPDIVPARLLNILGIKDQIKKLTDKPDE